MRFPIFFTVSLAFVALSSFSQDMQPHIVQLFGIVKTNQFNQKPIEMVTVKVKGEYRGTFSNRKGVFSIVCKVGDTLQFSHIGYKGKNLVVSSVEDVNVPFNYIEVLLEEQVITLPDFEQKALPTKEQFERDFVNLSIEGDLLSVASKNLSRRSINELLRTIPVDGSEATSISMAQQEQDFSSYKQQTGIQLLNPFAWVEFLSLLKSGGIKFRDKARKIHLYESQDEKNNRDLYKTGDNQRDTQQDR